MSVSPPESIDIKQTKTTLIEPKVTTQRGPLENLLTILRTKKILPYIDDACVLDFGCGSHLKTLRFIGQKARVRYGIDSAFVNKGPRKTDDGIGTVGSFDELREMLARDQQKITCILSLACFEHLESSSCREVLRELASVCQDDAILVGTVPTPPAKPVLEFLSYRLGLIDRSQIEDHKIYYDRETLTDMIRGTGWEMIEYRKFQLGMNSFFKLKRTPG